jgi:hypothetical protein
MFVGHGLLAFALAASVAYEREWPADRALAVGALAFLFGTLPDVDMVYAVFGLLSGAEGLFTASEAFWAAASIVHRAVTHSLVLGAIAATGFTVWRVRLNGHRRWSQPVLLAATLCLFGGMLLAVSLTSGWLATAIVGVYLLAGLAVVHVARWLRFGPRVVLGTALLGLLTHPFGDLFTGVPPQFLYPLDVTLVAQRVVLHADPTLNLLGIFLFELATIWLAVLVLGRLRGWQLLPRVRPRAALGVGYAAAVFTVPAPTLDVSWPFVFSVLAVGAVGVPIRWRRQLDDYSYTLVTALTAITLAVLAYATAYLLVG